MSNLFYVKNVWYMYVMNVSISMFMCVFVWMWRLGLSNWLMTWRWLNFKLNQTYLFTFSSFPSLFFFEQLVNVVLERKPLLHLQSFVFLVYLLSSPFAVSYPIVLPVRAKKIAIVLKHLFWGCNIVVANCYLQFLT